MSCLNDAENDAADDDDDAGPLMFFLKTLSAGLMTFCDVFCFCIFVFLVFLCHTAAAVSDCQTDV